MLDSACVQRMAYSARSYWERHDAPITDDLVKGIELAPGILSRVRILQRNDSWFRRTLAATDCWAELKRAWFPRDVVFFSSMVQPYVEPCIDLR